MSAISADRWQRASPHLDRLLDLTATEREKYLEALGQISTNAQKLVFLPYEASGIMASLGGIKELLQSK